jgi:dUTP pyrophosphatase
LPSNFENGLVLPFYDISKMSLYIYAENLAIRALLLRFREKYRSTDSGFDIPMEEQSVNMFYDTHMFNLGIKVAAVNSQMEPIPCLLMPRSSLAKTPFRMSNSIGLIDMGYRGNLMAAVDCYGKDNPYEKIANGTRLFQICHPTFMPWKDVHILELESDLPPPSDSRGLGGFGSTN